VAEKQKSLAIPSLFRLRAAYSIFWVLAFGFAWWSLLYFDLLSSITHVGVSFVF
jgi:hypothetical protein